MTIDFSAAEFTAALSKPGAGDTVYAVESLAARPDQITMHLAYSLPPPDEYALTGTLRPATIEALLDQVADVGMEAQIDEVGARIQRCMNALPGHEHVR